MIETEEATRESEKEEKGKGGQDLYRLWMDAIELSSKEEKDWREGAEKTVCIYRQEKPKSGDTYQAGDRKFNILHANVETLVPALYNSTPIPDVRRRYDDKNPVGKQVADILERGLSYSVDSYDFDETIRYSVYDMELTGRGVDRVRYMPYMGDDETVAYEEVTCEHVAWKHFRRGPGRTWPDVPWIAFELFLTRDELIKLSPKLGNQINLDSTLKGLDDKGDGKNPSEVFKRAKVWEIWDKDARKVLFFAESYRDGPIREEQDPLGLREFFPIPRPLYAVQTSDSLIPVIPYEVYKDQAEELERVSQRIMALTEAMKARGIYDARATEISTLADADDNTMVPIESVAVFADGSKLADKVLYWPIEVIVAALEKLYMARDQIKQTIYEITGIADILRGNTDPNETLGAQELKAQWGSLRIQRKQAEISRYARDIFRIKAEIIATKFEWQTISMMTGLKYPTQAEQQQAQQMLQQSQQQAQPGQPPQPPDPRIQEILSKPPLEAVLQMLKDDNVRGFNVDVESDSTIRADLTRKQQSMTQFLQGVAQYASAMGPIVMAPQFQSLAPAVIEVFSAFARNFKLGKQAEDALDAVADQAKQQAENPQPQQPSPEEQKLELEKQKAQMEQQAKAAELQMKAKEAEMNMQLKQREMEMKMAMEQQKLEHEIAIESQRANSEAQLAQFKAQTDAENARFKAETDASLNEREMQHKAAMGEQEIGLAREKTQAEIEFKRQDSEANRDLKRDEKDLPKRNQVKELEDKLSMAHDESAKLKKIIGALSEEISAPAQIIRGPDGRAAGVKKGNRNLKIVRGKDGRAVGLQ